MAERRSHEQFINDMSTINPNIEIVGEYRGSRQKVSCRCKICGYEWSAIPYDLLKGHGCKQCGHRESAEKRKKGIQAFLEELRTINPDIQPAGEYINSKTPISCRCKKCSYEWSSRPNDLLQGKGCPNCAGRAKKNTEEFVDELASKNPDVEVIGTYINSKTGIEVKCRSCGHIWSPIPSSLLRESGCPICAKLKSSRSRAKTHKKFVDDLLNINPNIIVLGEYKTSKTPLLCECRLCGTIWSPAPNTLLSGEGCPKCAQDRRRKSLTKSEEVFIDQLKDINPNIKVIGKYINTSKPIDCMCKVCGYKWPPRPHTLLKGIGCPNCANRPNKNTSIFTSELKSKNPNISVIGDYKNNRTPIAVRCKKCKYEWEATPYNLLAGHGCPICSHTNTSFMEQMILIGLRHALGAREVLSRDKDTIGLELDILIPKYSLAIEPGSWYYHRHSLDRDIQKQKSCKQKGIRLFTIYDNYHERTAPFKGDCLVFDFDLRNERAHISLKRIIYYLLSLMNIDYSFTEQDWEAIEKNALKCSQRGAPVKHDFRLQEYDSTIEIIGEKKSLHEPVSCRCKNCGHMWRAKPGRVIRCPKCTKTTRMDANLFAKKMRELSPKITVIGDYENTSVPVLCKCNECGYKWSPRPASLLKGSGCPNCAGRPKKDTETFKAEMESINPNVEVTGEYINNHTRISCLCRVCGYCWSTSPKSLIRGSGCPKCVGLLKKNTSLFREELAAISPDIELVGEYKNSRTAISVKCKICGYAWETMPYTLLKGCSHKNSKKLHEDIKL